MAFEIVVVLEDWKSAVIIPLYKGKGEMTGCSNYRGFSLSVVGKIYAEILVDSASKVVEGFIDDESKGALEEGGGV